MPVGDGLDKDGILGDLIPVDLGCLSDSLKLPESALVRTHVFEVLLLQDGEQEASHRIFAVRRHGEGLVVWAGTCLLDETLLGQSTVGGSIEAGAVRDECGFMKVCRAGNLDASSAREVGSGKLGTVK